MTTRFTQYYTFEEGGTLSLMPVARPTGSLTAAVYDAAGSLISSGSASLININTILNSAAQREDRTIEVSVTGAISSGTRFYLRNPTEQVRCKSISGNTVTLWAPLTQDHASGSNVEGTKLTYAISAASASQTLFDGRVQWKSDDTTIDYTACECVKYPMNRHASADDLRLHYPRLTDVLDAEQDIEEILDYAHDYTLYRLGSLGRARTFTASSEFRSVTALYALYTIFASREDSGELAQNYKNEFENQIGNLMEVLPRDANQDGVSEDRERMNWQTVRLDRR